MSLHAGKTWEEAVLWLRMQPDQQALVLGAYYDDPLIAAAERYWHSDEWAAVRSYLPACPPGARHRALDVGAGRGIVSYALARDGFATVALEPDPSAIVGTAAIRALAMESGLPIEVVQQQSEALPFEDASFDLVFVRAVLHHTVDMVRACAEFHRVLRPGGRLLAIREHVISRPGDLPAFFEVHPLHRLYGGEHAYLRREYEHAISATGLHILRVLQPFDSPINHAPLSRASLQAELVRRIAGGHAVFMHPLQRLLANDFVWSLSRAVLNLVDRRPGRLYSFVAERR